MRVIPSLICASWLLASAALAQSPVAVTIGPGGNSAAIPADFVGLSFGTRTLLPDKAGAHFFSATNQPLLTLFRNLGLRHLRIGGTSVEWPPTAAFPGPAEIDNLFAFAEAAQVRQVIYSFRLLETNANLHYAATNAALAKYIWDHYRASVDSFALGNEPDHKKVYGLHEHTATNFPAYLAKWRQFSGAIIQAVPEARFSGPDACSGNIDWTTRFAHAQKQAGLVKDITEHFYVGGAGRDVAVQKGIDDMLSPRWLSANQRLYDRMAVPVMADGLPYRFTEANDHYSGGVTGASDTFAGALWALDFLHWWAAHDARGVDFHNTQWVVNDVITLDSNHRLMVNPKGYGIRAFALGSHGSSAPVKLSNPDRVNLTAYAVRSSAELLVTLINKEHGPGAREVKVTLAASGPAERAAVIFLMAPNGDAAAKLGVTLGGASITADDPWRGEWKSLMAGQPGQYEVRMPAASAAVVRIPTE